MPADFEHLRDRLLRAGVAPRHVARYLTELTEHFEDLIAEEKLAGRDHDTSVSSDQSKTFLLGAGPVAQPQFGGE